MVTRLLNKNDFVIYVLYPAEALWLSVHLPKEKHTNVSDFNYIDCFILMLKL